VGDHAAATCNSKWRAKRQSIQYAGGEGKEEGEKKEKRTPAFYLPFFTPLNFKARVADEHGITATGIQAR